MCCIVLAVVLQSKVDCLRLACLAWLAAQFICLFRSAYAQARHTLCALHCDRARGTIMAKEQVELAVRGPCMHACMHACMCVCVACCMRMLKLGRSSCSTRGGLTGLTSMALGLDRPGWSAAWHQHATLASLLACISSACLHACMPMLASMTNDSAMRWSTVMDMAGRAHVRAYRMRAARRDKYKVFTAAQTHAPSIARVSKDA